MPERIVSLVIEKLAGLGDGMGMLDDKKVFVPYTLAGDEIRARMVRETSDADYAVMETLLVPSEGRIQQVCMHFTRCGACSLQHVAAPIYTDFKQQMAREAVRKAGFDMNLVEPLIQMPANGRRRTELKVAKGKLGYHARSSNAVVDILECKVVEPELEQLIFFLKPQLLRYAAITNLQINGVDGGYDVLIDVLEPVKLNLSKHPLIRRLSVRHNSKLEILFQAGPVTVTIGKVVVEVPPGAFLQASRIAQGLITEMIVKATTGAKQVMDLFSGVGTYAFALAEHSAVMAVEGDGAMVRAMQEAVTKHAVTHLTAKQQDLFYAPVPASELGEFDAVVINPPRAGAFAQVQELAKAKVKKIVMVSCNPATFARDARALKGSGYKLGKVTPIDQFVYSSHLEMVAEFTL